MTIRNAPTPEIRAMIGSKFDEFEEWFARLERLNQKVAAADATVKQWNEATKTSPCSSAGWIARQMGTDTGKRRTFSGITPAAGSASNTYADLRSFVTEAVSAPAFIPGRGMLISLSFVPEPGHSIAAHKESAESYVLFDPNLGIYRCKGLARLVTALVVLVEECYLTAEPGKPVTALGSGHAWYVFCRTSDLVPGTATVNANVTGHGSRSTAREPHANRTRTRPVSSPRASKKRRASGPRTRRLGRRRRGSGSTPTTRRFAQSSARVTDAEACDRAEFCARRSRCSEAASEAATASAASDLVHASRP
jgi:hypothetical protein